MHVQSTEKYKAEEAADNPRGISRAGADEENAWVNGTVRRLCLEQLRQSCPDSSHAPRLRSTFAPFSHDDGGCLVDVLLVSRVSAMVESARARLSGSLGPFTI